MASFGPTTKTILIGSEPYVVSSLFQLPQVSNSGIRLQIEISWISDKENRCNFYTHYPMKWAE